MIGRTDGIVQASIVEARIAQTRIVQIRIVQATAHRFGRSLSPEPSCLLRVVAAAITLEDAAIARITRAHARVRAAVATVSQLPSLQSSARIASANAARTALRAAVARFT